jgi:hypothetical protein
MNTGLRLDMLPPIPELHFDEDAHRYQYDGKWLPLSPTQVLSFDMDEEAKQRINETKEGPDGWEIRGNTLHGCLEQFLLGAAELDPKQFREWWEPLRNCWLWEDVTIMGVELRMSDKKRMGGSCDFLVKQKDGTVVLGDLKTVSSAKAVDRRKPATAQLGAYLFLMSKSYPKVMVDKCVTVVAGPGKTKVLTDDPAQCWLAWEDAMSRYQAHQDLHLGF